MELVKTSLFTDEPPCLGSATGGGGGGVIKDTTYLMNIADKILLALKFESTQKYPGSKSQHCQLNKKNESLPFHCHFLLLDSG